MRTLREIMNIIGRDDDDGEWAASSQRRQKIEHSIRFAFGKCGIAISSSEDAIFYDEEENRIARVTLDATEIPLTILSKLLNSGLSKDFMVSFSHMDELTIEFEVSSEMDNSI